MASFESVIDRLLREVSSLRQEVRALKENLRRVNNKVQSSVVRGTIDSVDDGTSAQSLRIRTYSGRDAEEDEVDDQVENFACPFGLTSHPPSGSEVLALGVGGQRAHTVVTSVNHRASRPHVEPGETALYALSGNKVYLQSLGVTSIISEHVHVGDLVSLLAAARVTDPVASTPAMAAWMTQITQSLLEIAAPFNVDPPGSPVVSLGSVLGPKPPPLPAPTGIGLISSGSSKVTIS